MLKIPSKIRKAKKRDSGRSGVRLPALKQISNWLDDHKALGGFLVAIGVLLAWLFLQLPTALKNVHDFPEQARPVANKFLSWYYEDRQWEGLWSSFPEGLVDMGDMNLSDTDIHLDIEAENGRIRGMLTSRKVCEKFPYLQSLMFEGVVSGRGARVIVFDYIGGKRVNIASLRLARHDGVITLATIDDQVMLFSGEVRIGRHPDAAPTTQQDLLTTHCAKYRSEIARHDYELFMKNKEEKWKAPDSISPKK